MGRKNIHFITNQVPRSIPLQLPIQHRQDTLDLLAVPVSRLTKRLVLLEPDSLSIVRALTTHLEMKPLLDEVLFGRLAVPEGVGLVIGLLQLCERLAKQVGGDVGGGGGRGTHVFDDSTRFPQGDSGVWVFDSGDSAIDANLLVGILL